MAKGKTLEKIWEKMPEARKARISARADELIAEYKTLQEVRKSAGLTQARVSETLNMPQSNISRLEKSSDMLISTLREYVEAIGGTLNLTVELPDQPPVVLSGISDLIETPDNPAP